MRAKNVVVVQHAQAYRQSCDCLTLSVISVMEMVKGLQQVQKVSQIQALLSRLSSEEVLWFDQPTAELAGRIRGELDRTGQTVGMADPMIAAVAIRNGLELETGNISHYQRIQQLGDPLTLVNWKT